MIEFYVRQLWIWIDLLKKLKIYDIRGDMWITLTKNSLWYIGLDFKWEMWNLGLGQKEFSNS